MRIIGIITKHHSPESHCMVVFQYIVNALRIVAPSVAYFAGQTVDSEPVHAGRVALRVAAPTL